MIINLDGDGPLFNLTGDSVRAVNAQFGTDYTPDMWKDWDASFLPPEHNRWMRRTLWEDPGFWRDLTPTHLAQSGVAVLRKAGHKIRVVTSAYESCVGWEHARRHALKKHFDIPHSVVTVTAQKADVWGEVFIDDKPEHVRAWDDKWCPGNGIFGCRMAVLFAMPHNADHAHQTRADWPWVVEAFT